jgi:isoquinoline 1-oxidoreductase beta subunit
MDRSSVCRNLDYWAALDESGTPIGWKARLVQSSILARRPRPGQNNFAGGTALGGIVPASYSIPNRRTEYVSYEPGIRVGFWRAPSGSITGYMTESFIDELAVAAGKDPYKFRRDLLSKEPRVRGVLDLAAEKAGWGTPLPAGRFRGISAGETIGSYAAHVVEISVATDGKVRVHRVVCAVDVGWTINPEPISTPAIEGFAFDEDTQVPLSGVLVRAYEVDYDFNGVRRLWYRKQFE